MSKVVVGQVWRSKSGTEHVLDDEGMVASMTRWLDLNPHHWTLVRDIPRPYGDFRDEHMADPANHSPECDCDGHYLSKKAEKIDVSAGRVEGACTCGEYASTHHWTCPQSVSSRIGQANALGEPCAVECKCGGEFPQWRYHHELACAATGKFFDRMLAEAQAEPDPCAAAIAALPVSEEHIAAAAATFDGRAMCAAEADLRRKLALRREWPTCKVSGEPLQVRAEVREVKKNHLQSASVFAQQRCETLHLWQARCVCVSCEGGR